MSQITNFWRFVTPATRKQLYTTVAQDSYNPASSEMMGSSIAAVSWYTQIMRGVGTRLNSYKQYDVMDNDVDIARSLDIIAEEMTEKVEKTNLPFEINYHKEDNEDVSDTTAITLRQAVRQWSKTQALDTRLFSIARTLVKYGDCFFRKVSDTQKWIYLDPSLVAGIEVDQFGKIINYHIRKPTAPNQLGMGLQKDEIDIVPAAGVVHFTLSDDMGSAAPYGQSILRPIHRTYSQLTLLENAIIIYRIVRAPERRVFYIDTGNMPPQRVKQYLETIKNEMRQKKVPGVGAGRDIVDGQVDVNLMQEDMFFPVSASGRGSRVETLPGGTEDFGTGLLKIFQDKIFRGLRIPTSYMTGVEGAGAQVNDGKVGITYIEELRFAKFVKRLQDQMNKVLDQEFKVYLKVVGLQISSEVFSISLPEPANFALYRQAALDADLINTYSNIREDKLLSKRFILKRYLGLSDDEIQMNEALVKEERGIEDMENYSALRQIYDPAIYDGRENITIEEPQFESNESGFDEMGGFNDEPSFGDSDSMNSGINTQNEPTEEKGFFSDSESPESNDEPPSDEMKTP